MRKIFWVIVMGLVLVGPGFAQGQVDKIIDRFFEKGEGGGVLARDLRVLELEFLRDPVLEGERVGFRVTIVNDSRRSGRVSLLIKDRDEVVNEARGVAIRPGENRIDFPERHYRFSRADVCFTVEVDIEGRRRPLVAAKEFCARRTFSGWTLSDKGVGPIYVEELEMLPDPAVPGQEIRFRVKLRNDGRPVRGSLRIQDKDEVIAQVDNVLMPRGIAEFQFPFTRYAFQRSDRCFTVVVNIEGTSYPVDAAKEFCARRTFSGWTLSDKGVGPIYVEELEMFPDPAVPGQDIRFRVKLRNDGRPVRGSLRIQDKDQVLIQVDEVLIPRGVSEFQFPRTRYTFWRFDHCFGVVVDIERTPYPVDAAREFCAKPVGWTLRP